MAPRRQPLDSFSVKLRESVVWLIERWKVVLYFTVTIVAEHYCLQPLLPENLYSLVLWTSVLIGLPYSLLAKGLSRKGMQTLLAIASTATHLAKSVEEAGEDVQNLG